MSKPRSKLLNLREMLALASLNQGWSDEKTCHKWGISQMMLDGVRAKTTLCNDGKYWIIGDKGEILLKENVSKHPGIFVVKLVIHSKGAWEQENGPRDVAEDLAAIGK